MSADRPDADVQITQLLAEAAQRPSAAEQLLPLVYENLRALAARFLADQRIGHTLQPTALVHEAYVRLVGHRKSDGDTDCGNNWANNWDSRAHFFAVAAKAMRQILVNHAIARRTAKRGGDWSRVTLSEAAEPAADRDVDIESLNDALHRLEALDERQVRIVELRYFGGLTMVEIARVLDVSLSTIEKDWRMARSWLQRELES